MLNSKRLVLAHFWLAFAVFGLALVLMMLYRPAGILPSAVRKRELAKPENGN